MDGAAHVNTHIVKKILREVHLREVFHQLRGRRIILKGPLATRALGEDHVVDIV
jgi:hypothetical protein